MHEVEFLSFSEKKNEIFSALRQSLTFSDLSFMRKIPFFSLTHDLSHEILYAFGSVIKLICHFFHHLGEKEQRENPQSGIYHLDESSESLPHYLSET